MKKHLFGSKKAHAFAVHITKWMLLIAFCLYPAVAVPSTPPTLDGRVDTEYHQYGFIGDYYGLSAGAAARLYVIDNTSVDPDYVWLAWVVAKSFNDNSYGANQHPTWPRGHSFFDLYESDKQRMQIFNACRDMVVDATMDLVEPTAGTPSGYGADMFHGAESVRTYINGGNWDPSYFDFTTSTVYNLNHTGYCTGGTCGCGGTNLLTASPLWLNNPPGPDDYTPVASCDQWIYEIIWEIRVHRSVLVTGTCPQGGVDIPSIIEPIELHASPSKTLNYQETMFLAASSIGDSIWLDRDRDGIQDIGEPGIANVTLELWSDPDGDGDASDGAPLFTTTTNSDGKYLFPSLAAVSYVVKVVDAYGILSGMVLTSGPAAEDAKTLAVNENYWDADFGYAPADSTRAVIGDYVWSDADNDGMQDPGEPGFGGVTLELRRVSDDALMDTLTTAADGSYLFKNVDPGTYYVDVTDTGGVLSGYALTFGPQSASDPTVPITVGAGAIYLNADFGYYRAGLGSIGNQIWLDLDEDGYYDGGDERGIPNIVVDLISDANQNGAWDAGEPIIASTYTALDGTYSFNGLNLDDGDGDFDYIVNVSDTNYLLARLYHQKFGAAGVNNNGQRDPYAVSLSSGSPSDQTADFAYMLYLIDYRGVVGDTVWYDKNRNGIQEEGEQGIPNVTVELWSVKNGIPDILQGTAVTDANGFYYFSLLVLKNNGSQFAVRVAAGNFIYGGPLYQLTGTSQPDNQDESAVLKPLVNQNIDMTLDFGYWYASAQYRIGDRVWRDADADGFQDAGETGIAGVTLALYRDLNGNGIIDTVDTVIGIAATDSGGNYIFTDLPNGHYIVGVTDAAGVLQNYTLTSGLDRYPISIVNADRLDADFGYINNISTGSIGDYVWLDGDRDGLQDVTERGIAGVTLRLYSPGPDNAIGGGDDVLLGTTTTDVNGKYLFSSLPAGRYYVDVLDTTIPSGLVITTGSTDPYGVINLSDGQQFREADFGYGSAPGTSALGDFVWYDADGDGIQDPGETGIGGVELTITGPSYPGGTTVTTAANGAYLVTGLSPGNYTVTVNTATLPSGFNTTPTNGPAGRTLYVPSGMDVLTFDYGFDAPAGLTGSIGDTVYYDLDADGMEDAGEPGIQDVTLSLFTDPDGDGDPADGMMIASTFTNASGYYHFTGLAAGSYVVMVTDYNNVLSSYNPTGDPDEPGRCMVCNERGASTLAPGSMVDSTLDFGYYTSGGTIGNYVWYDLDGGGFVSADELGIQGVTIDLWLDVDSDGVITPSIDNYLRTATTDANGGYQFAGLAAGVYLVQVTDTDNVLAGYTKTSGASGVDSNSQDNPYQVTLAAGSMINLTADFGYDGPEPNVAYSIGDLIWIDADADGFKDAVESGIGGVTLVLHDDRDANGVIDAGDPIIRQATTAGDGSYLFDKLPAGYYIVNVTDACNVLASYIHATGTAHADNYSQVNPYPVHLSDQDIHYADFGFVPEEATAVAIGHFGAYDKGGKVVVRWQTLFELRTAGFYLYRLNEKSGKFNPLNAKILPAMVNAPAGGWYCYEDPGAKTGEYHAYQLEEVEVDGHRNTYGPWLVYAGTPPPSEESSVKMEPLPALSGFSRKERPLSAKERSRMEAKIKARLKGTAAQLSLQGSRAKIGVSEDGLYLISADEISRVLDVPRADVENHIGANNIRLRCREDTVSVLPADDSSGIYFYGQKLDTLYTNENIYWLDINPGRRMAAVKSKPAKASATRQYFQESVLAEKNLLPAVTVVTDPKEDYWMWDYVQTNSAHSKVTLTVSTLGMAGGGTGVISVALLGATDDPAAEIDHHAVISLNGTVIGETSWSGFNPQMFTASVSTDLFNDGPNHVEIAGVPEIGVSFDIFYINNIKIDYPRLFSAAGEVLDAETAGHHTITVNGFTDPGIVLFDITDPVNPAMVTGATILPDASVPGEYIAVFKPDRGMDRFIAAAPGAIHSGLPAADQPSALKSTANRADYLVITAGYMTAAARTLAGYRASQGYSTMVVDIEDIYDEFSYGIKDAEAIREFLAYAYANWQAGPKYVVLAGEGSYDYKGNLGKGDSIIPAMLAGTPEGLYVTDNWFADVAGEDRVPEFAVGRIPVIDENELDAYTLKVIAYEAAAGPWEKKVMLAADRSDEGGDFTADSREVEALFPADFSLDIIYLDAIPMKTARTRFLAGFNAGRAYINFIGHGGPFLIGNQNLFSTGSLSGLANGDTMPVFTAMTCLAGNFGYPGFDTLNEAIVLKAPGGAAAMWSPSGFAFNRHSVELCKGFYQAVFHDGDGVIGDAIMSAKQNYAAQGEYLYYLDLYNLIGDPALRVK